MRRFGQPPAKGTTYRRRPGVYAILARGPDALVTYQAGRHNEYQLPGGGVDPGESPLWALHREVREETGWRIARPRVWRRFKRFVFMPEYDLWAEKICTIYIATPVRPLHAPLEPDHSAIWMTLSDAAMALAVSGDRSAVRDFISAGT